MDKQTKINEILDSIVEGSSNYAEIVKSDNWKEYIVSDAKNLYLPYSISGPYGVLGGLPDLYVEGNLEKITICNDNLIYLDIVYDNTPNFFGDMPTLRVCHISDKAEYQKFIRMLDIPCGVKADLCKVEYKVAGNIHPIDNYFIKSLDIKKEVYKFE